MEDLRCALIESCWHREARGRLTRSRASYVIDCSGEHIWLSLSLVLNWKGEVGGQKLRKLTVIGKSQTFWTGCYRDWGLASCTGCCRGCRSELYYHMWSGHFPFVYYLLPLCSRHTPTPGPSFRPGISLFSPFSTTSCFYASLSYATSLLSAILPA